jgi:hypothetical protein
MMTNPTALTRNERRNERRNSRIRRSAGRGKNTFVSIMVPIQLTTATPARSCYSLKAKKASQIGRPQKGLHKDFKSEYKNKSRDLNILQKEVKKWKDEVQKENKKWIKVNERIQESSFEIQE